ncbi:MAG: hypothetical protein VKO65_04910 [Cyanobacteriota bacterium]|nr:hypothetical protein [Cyanobacteriota bacterium]
MAAILLFETGDVLAEVEWLRSLAFTADSNLYVPPSSADQAGFLALADALWADEESLAVSLAVSLADALGDEVVRFTDNISGRRFLGTRERLMGGAQTLGWSSYFLQPAVQRDALLEVPHGRFELHSEELGARRFRDSGARGFLMAGAHRQANGPGSADMADQSSSIVQQAQASWIGADAGTTSFQVSDSLLSGVSSSTSLVPYGAIWLYRADGSDQGSAWRAFDFAASGWASGAAQLGYGDGDEATVVPSGPSGASFITTYFRRDFNLADPAALERLDLSVIRDDGVVVYLNGQEVLRNNIGANPQLQHGGHHGHRRRR